MKRQRYPWWGYVKNIMSLYPDGEMTDGERKAVYSAAEDTKKMPEASDRLEIIKRVYFDRTHKLYGAALLVPCSERTAQRYQRDFMMLVAEHRGLLK